MRTISGAILCLSLFGSVFSESVPLTISIDGKKTVLSRDDLVKHVEKINVVIDNDRAYPQQQMHHEAVPLCKLLASFPIDKQSMVELISTDDFHVFVPAAKIMNCNKEASMALLAIEPNKKWPIINNHTNTTAGPYEIIWLQPEKSLISNEYWAWSVVEIKLNQYLRQANVIQPPKTNISSVRDGYKIYISHCEGCHTMNHIGKALIGPDLNFPKNPLEYYSNKQQLTQFIRDPQTIREGRMNGSDETFLPQKELDNLIAYFAFMLEEKKNHS